MRPFPLALLVPIVLLGPHHPLPAQLSQTYSGPNPANTWDTSSPNWDGGLAWTNGNHAVFGGAGQTVDVDGAVTVSNITFNSTGYTITDPTNDGSLTLVGAPSIISVTTAGHTATIGESLSGSGGFTKAGQGALTLSGANSYTGITTLSTGTLTLANNAALGAAGPGNQTLINFNAGSSTGGLLRINPGLTIAEDFVLQGTGDASPFSSAIAVNGGSATLSGTITLTGTTQFRIGGGGTMIWDGAISRSTPSAGGLVFGGTNIFNQPIQNNGGTLFNHATSTFNAAGNNFADIESAYNGTLRFGIANALLPTTNVRLGAGSSGAAINGTLDLNGFNQTINGFSTLSAAGTSNAAGNRIVTNSGITNATLTVGANNASTLFDGVIQDGATATTALVKTGTGTQTLSGNSTYSGGTTIAQGTLSITSNNALGTGTVTVQTGSPTATNARLLLANGVNLANPITLSGTATPGTPSIDLTSGSATVSGLITILGNTRIRSSPGSTLNIEGGVTGTNPFFVTNANGTVRYATNPVTIGSGSFYTDSGGLTVVAVSGNAWGETRLISGTIRTDVANALPATTTVNMGGAGYGSGGKLDLNGFNQTISGITHGGTAAGLVGTNIGSATPATLTVNQNATTSYRGGLTGALALTKGGTGTLTLTGEFAAASGHHSGDTRITGGTLALANTGILRNSTLDTGPAGPQQLTFTAPGTNTYLLGGLKGEDDLAFGANSLDVGANDQSNSFAGSLSGTGTITKSGTGTQILTGASTYSGGTFVADGKLLANNPTGSATGSGSVTVASGATLGGIGTIAPGANGLTVLSGGTLSPGNSPGTLNVSGDVLLSPGSIFDVDLAIGGIATTGTDRLAIDSGTVTLSGATLTGTWGGNASNIYNGNLSTETLLWLITGASSLTPGFANATPAPGFAALFGDPLADPYLTAIGGQSFALFYNADFSSTSLSGGNDLLLIAVPEPSRALLVTLSLALFLSRRRRPPQIV